MREANRLFCTGMGLEACGDEGSAFELESDVGGCSEMLLETETSFASAVLLEIDLCVLERFS